MRNHLTAQIFLGNFSATKNNPAKQSVNRTSDKKRLVLQNVRFTVLLKINAQRMVSYHTEGCYALYIMLDTFFIHQLCKLFLSFSLGHLFGALQFYASSTPTPVFGHEARPLPIFCAQRVYSLLQDPNGNLNDSIERNFLF